MLPTRWFYKFPEKPTLLAHYTKVCVEKGIPYFDAQSAISQLSKIWERKPETFFSDDAHLTIFMARCLGGLLAIRIQGLFSRVTERNLALGKARSPYSQFSHIPLSRPDEEVECVTRSTSMVSESFVRLTAGASLEVDVGMGCEVVGLVLNMAQTNGALLIEGMNTVTKRLDNLYFDPDRSLWLVVWGLLTPVYSATGKFRITGLDRGDLNSFEDNDHRRDSKDNSAGYPTVVELQGLVIKYSKTEGDLLLVNGVDLNLGNKMEFSMIAPSLEW